MGGGLPAEIWHQIMDISHAGKAPLALPGTLRQMPGAAAHRPQRYRGCNWLRVRLGCRILELPWLSGRRSTPPSRCQRSCKRQRSSTPALGAPLCGSRPPEQPAYPRERISEVSLRRHWRKCGGSASRTAADETATPGRLRGMMSLGAWW
jgi:hypothetical protein